MPCESKKTRPKTNLESQELSFSFLDTQISCACSVFNISSVQMTRFETKLYSVQRNYKCLQEIKSSVQMIISRFFSVRHMVFFFHQC